MRSLQTAALLAAASLLACDPGPTEPVDRRHDDISRQLCGLHTETQTRWGAECGQPGPACLRDKFFLELFPEGLYAGCGERTVNLLNSEAVAAALPTVGKPRALDPSEVGAFDGKDDPVVGTALFGHTVALALNIEFSTLPAFGQPLALGELVVVDPESPCNGMTAQQVLDEANANLGLCDTVFTATTIHACVLAINNAFAAGDQACSALLAPADELR